MEKFLLGDIPLEFLLAQIEAFEKFLRRTKKIAEKRKEGYLNGLKIIKKIGLGIAQLKVSDKWKHKIIEEIEKMQLLLGRVWLKNRIRKL